MSLDLVSHEGILNPASNSGNDQIHYGSDFAFARANLQPISGSQKQTELGIEGEAMYTLYLDRLTNAEVGNFTLSSKVKVRLIGGTDYRYFFVHSKPIIHESEPGMEHIEIVLKENVFV